MKGYIIYQMILLVFCADDKTEIGHVEDIPNDFLSICKIKFPDKIADYTLADLYEVWPEISKNIINDFIKFDPNVLNKELRDKILYFMNFCDFQVFENFVIAHFEKNFHKFLQVFAFFESEFENLPHYDFLFKKLEVEFLKKVENGDFYDLIIDKPLKMKKQLPKFSNAYFRILMKFFLSRSFILQNHYKAFNIILEEVENTNEISKLNDGEIVYAIKHIMTTQNNTELINLKLRAASLPFDSIIYLIREYTQTVQFCSEDSKTLKIILNDRTFSNSELIKIIGAFHHFKIIDCSEYCHNSAFFVYSKYLLTPDFTFLELKQLFSSMFECKYNCRYIYLYKSRKMFKNFNKEKNLTSDNIDELYTIVKKSNNAIFIFDFILEFYEKSYTKYINMEFFDYLSKSDNSWCIQYIFNRLKIPRGNQGLSAAIENYLENQKDILSTEDESS